MRTYISAIAFVHKLHHQPDPTSSFMVAKTLQGIRNQQPSSGPQLLPITRDILHTLLQALPFAVPTPYQLSLWRAIFLLTFHGCLRAGEVTLASNSNHLLQYSQINISSGTIRLTFRSYKHSRGDNPTVTIAQEPHRPICPVVALETYILKRGTSPGPLFIHHDHCTVTRSQFSAVLKSTATLCSLQAHHYNTHSFRAGRATQMAADGQSDQTIRAAGRWKSSAFQRYIRPAEIILPRNKP